MSDSSEIFLSVRVLNFSTEEVANLDVDCGVEIDDAANFPQFVDLFILIEPDLAWLDKHQSKINNTDTVTFILTKDKKFFAIDKPLDCIDQVIVVGEFSFNEVVTDFVAAVSCHYISVTFDNFMSLMRSGSQAQFVSTGDIDSFIMDERYLALLRMEFLNCPKAKKYPQNNVQETASAKENIKALFLMMSVSTACQHGSDNLLTTILHFQNYKPEHISFGAAGSLKFDDSKTRVSAIVVS